MSCATQRKQFSVLRDTVGREGKPLAAEIAAIIAAVVEEHVHAGEPYELSVYGAAFLLAICGREDRSQLDNPLPQRQTLQHLMHLQQALEYTLRMAPEGEVDEVSTLSPSPPPFSSLPLHSSRALTSLLPAAVLDPQAHTTHRSGAGPISQREP